MQIIIAKLSESLQKPAKSCLQKLAKPKYFYKSMFAKVCQSTYILHLQILVKHNLWKPNCKTVGKVYLFLAPPLLLALCRTSLPNLVILNVFTLFAITILNPIVSADFLIASLSRYANQPMMKYKASYMFWEHKIVCNLPDLSCIHIFFHFKSLSRLSWNDRTSASLIQFSLNIFSISSTLANGRRK